MNIFKGGKPFIIGDYEKEIAAPIPKIERSKLLENLNSKWGIEHNKIKVILRF